jgi:hypothetical protein
VDIMSRILVGAAMALIGGYLWLRTQTANAVCSSVLGALDAQDCQRVTIAHTIYGLVTLAGAALLAWGVWASVHRQPPGPGQPG